jgi:hypothetical protein
MTPICDNKKRRGRPATGITKKFFAKRLTDDEVVAVTELLSKGVVKAAPESDEKKWKELAESARKELQDLKRIMDEAAKTNHTGPLMLIGKSDDKELKKVNDMLMAAVEENAGLREEILGLQADLMVMTEMGLDEKGKKGWHMFYALQRKVAGDSYSQTDA